MSLGLCLLAAAALTGCALGPQMQMAVPGDSAEYNGKIVKLHSIDEGDFGVAAANADGSADLGDLKDLVVDSLPALEYRIGPLDMVQVQLILFSVSRLTITNTAKMRKVW